MLTEFKQHITSSFPQLAERKMLLACSGGIDSVVLAHLLQQIGVHFSLAHCNFKLRGKESDQDAVFVAQLAENLKSDLYTVDFETETYATEKKLSIQMAARQLRYNWFNSLLATDGFDVLLTAHNADDNLETFIINLSRGTGIEGLTGIPWKTDKVYRPLLPFSRKQIARYALKNQITWREDASNADTKYLRNKIRKEVVPVLKELHPTFEANFLKTQENLSQTAIIADNALNQLRHLLFRSTKGVYYISIAELQKLTPQRAYLYALFRPYGFSDGDAISELLQAMSGKYLISKTHQLLKDRENLILVEIGHRSQVNNEHFIDQGVGIINHPITLFMEPVDERGDNTDNEIFVDSEKIQYPLTLRRWKPGDYFYPFGSTGRKKMAKFFKDEKMNIVSKSEQWLLCANEDIMWVVGRRMDDRYKVKNETCNILRIRWEE